MNGECKQVSIVHFSLYFTYKDLRIVRSGTHNELFQGENHFKVRYLQQLPRHSDPIPVDFFWWSFLKVQCVWDSTTGLERFRIANQAPINATHEKNAINSFSKIWGRECAIALYETYNIFEIKICIHCENVDII